MRPLIKYFLILAALLLCLSGCSKKSTVEIRYAAWNLGKEEDNGLERQMIAAFMQENPSIKVVIDESFVGNYDQAMSDATAQNTIPDVFMYGDISKAYDNNLSLDLTQIVAEDEEWAGLPEVIRDSTYVKGSIAAIPSAIYFFGYFCNNDVLKAGGLSEATPGISLEEFIETIKASTNIEQGRIGLADSSSICEWYPAAVNAHYGWFTWDGGKFNINSQEFMDGVNLAKELNQGKYSYALLDTNDQEELHGKNDWEAWNAGSVAFKFDGSWSQNDYSKLPYDISFIGMPGGRTCYVPDYLLIAKNSAHPEEAYQFAKFMSAYSKDGFSKRMTLAKEQGFQVTTIPMIQDQAILTQYFDLVKMKGIREVYDNFNTNAYIEETKVLPGYVMARWNYQTNIDLKTTENARIGDVINAACLGEIDIADIAEQLNYLANTCIQIYPQQLSN